MLQITDFPSVEDIYFAISDLPQEVEPDMIPEGADEPGIDVRLQVDEDGGWSIHTGDSQFDTDHRGWWGSGTVSANDGPKELRELASDLREQAIDDCAECEELDTKATAGFERFEIVLEEEDADQAHHQGECSQDAKEVAETPYVAKQLDEIGADQIRAELREYGAWNEEELKDSEMNRTRIVWIAAGNLQGERKHPASEINRVLSGQLP